MSDIVSATRGSDLQNEICGMTKRNGDPCLNPRGMGTDHPGEGPCMYHDNSTLVKQVSRSSKDRYSRKVARSALEMYMEMLNDPEILSIDAEIAMLRSTMGDLEQMIDEIREDGDGRLLPKGEFRNDHAHKAVLSLMDKKVDLAKSIAIMVERKKKMEEGRMVSYKEVEQVLAQVAFIIKNKCEGCNNLPRIAEEFAQIDITKVMGR